uniref:Reverse transcriptase domain-containing protein n=1 Tax=Strongyloides papillosus TaxID=174720 RepID=A0A0N5BYT0_STREA
MAFPVKNKSFMAHYIPYKDYKQKELYGKYLRAATYALDDSDKFTIIISLIPRDWSEQFFSETIEEDNLEPEWTDLLEFINRRTALYKDSTGPTKDAMTSLLDKVTNHARGLDVKQFNPQEFLTITSFIAKIPRSYQLELCADGCLPSLDDIRKFAFKKDREFSIKKKEYANNNIKTLKPKPEKKWLGNNKAKDQQVTSEKKPLITISKKKEVPSEMLQTLMESICTAPIKLECVGKTFTAKIDTCAGISLIGNQLFNRLPPSTKEKINLNDLITTKSAHDTCRTHKGSLELDFTLPNEKLMSGKFFLSGNDDTAITIGFDTIQKNFIDIRKYMKSKSPSHESHLIHNIKVTLGEECETIVEFLNDPKNINLIQEDVNFTPILNSDLPLKETFKPKIAPLLPVKAEILPTVCNMLESEIEKGWLKYAKEPITSAGNLIVVHQHNEKLRLCYNIRNINDYTPDPDEMNLPSLKSLLETPLDNIVTFTKLDISDAYRSIGINESDQWKTAVRTPIGTLVSTRLIFGHKLSPQIFCQALDEALSGIPFLKCYMDDLLILAPYGKEDDTIISTLKALKEAGFRINLKKSEFKVKSTTYLGLVWDIENGISIPEDKVKSILSMNSPTSIKDLHTKICKMAFYSNMVVNFSELAAPFFDLIGKKEKMKKLIWSDELETQFRKLTSTFAQSIHLFAIPSKLSKVHATISTASRSALCILDAENDKKKRSIFYIHERKLKPTEQRYIPEQKGLMILCEALSQHINITTACPIIVHSNKNLTKLINNQIIPSSASSSFQKYLILLLPFQLTGSSMKANDHLVSELRYPISVQKLI